MPILRPVTAAGAGEKTVGADTAGELAGGVLGVANTPFFVLPFYLPISYNHPKALTI